MSVARGRSIRTTVQLLRVKLHLSRLFAKEIASPRRIYYRSPQVEANSVSNHVRAWDLDDRRKSNAVSFQQQSGSDGIRFWNLSAQIWHF